MKLFTCIGILALAVAFGCQSATSTTAETAKADSPSQEELAVEVNADDEAPRITLADAKAAFDKNEAVFIDTRADSFFENEHVKGAMNVTTSSSDETYKEIPKDKKIIAYCS